MGMKKPKAISQDGSFWSIRSESQQPQAEAAYSNERKVAQAGIHFSRRSLKAGPANAASWINEYSITGRNQAGVSAAKTATVIIAIRGSNKEYLIGIQCGRR